jgi:ABC-type antimicrobial peptide transport system permease subunit
MNYVDSIFASLQALRVNVMRSVLTTLGIIIGVAAVISMVSVGAGAEAQVNELIRSLGANLIIVLPGTTTSGGVRLGHGTQLTLTEDDAAAIQREIGLRMAVGARGRDILTQFLIEAVTLSLIGGLIGIAMGVGGSIAITFSGGWPMIIEIQSVFLAFGFSAAVGIFFGFYPARKAANLDPIEALRYE